MITERTKALVINTPNNPSGTCFTRETMENIAMIAKKHDLIVIADDIYGSFSYQEPFIPMLTLDGMRERTITINSFSKDFTMTGWRVGEHNSSGQYNKRDSADKRECCIHRTFNTHREVQYNALRNRKTIQRPMIEEYRKRAFYAAARINNIPKLSVLPPKGTFYLFVSIKEMGMTSAAASELILKEAQYVLEFQEMPSVTAVKDILESHAQ